MEVAVVPPANKQSNSVWTAACTSAVDVEPIAVANGVVDVEEEGADGGGVTVVVGTVEDADDMILLGSSQGSDSGKNTGEVLSKMADETG